jgi:hypothetical protein
LIYLLSLVVEIAVQTEVLVCFDLIPAAALNSPVNISVTLLKSLSLQGMYRETNEVPLLRKC